MNTKANLQVGQAYIVDDKPMVLTQINTAKERTMKSLTLASLTGTLRLRSNARCTKSDCEILDNLEVAEEVDRKIYSTD